MNSFWRFTLIGALALWVGCASAASTRRATRTTSGTLPTSGTSYLMGRVVCNDSRILDLSGRYTLSGNDHTVVLSIVQDPRGFLATTATIALNDGRVTGPVTLSGRLNVMSTGPLVLSLRSSGRMTSSPVRQGNFGSWRPPYARRTSVTLVLNGVYTGEGFETTVTVAGFGPTETFRALLVPRKPARGFFVADAPSVAVAPGVYRSSRVVTFPWGKMTYMAVQTNRNTGITFQLPTGMPRFMPSIFNTFNMMLTAKLLDEQLLVGPTKVKVGYGFLSVAPEDVQVTPSAYPLGRSITR